MSEFTGRVESTAFAAICIVIFVADSCLHPGVNGYKRNQRSHGYFGIAHTDTFPGPTSGRQQRFMAPACSGAVPAMLAGK